MTSIYEKLESLQQEFKAPKSEFNSHGNFKYRTLEKMLETFKPLAKKHRVLLVLSDGLKECAETPHIVAKATLVNLEDPKDQIIVEASAQEAAIQKVCKLLRYLDQPLATLESTPYQLCFLVDDTDEIDNKEGDQDDWDAEITSAKDVKTLMKIFNRMNADTKKAFTDKLSERKRELTEEVIDGNTDNSSAAQ